MHTSTFEIEQEFATQGYDIIIGTDEVGRGPLAGPVVACAVALRNSQLLKSKNQTSSEIRNVEYEIQNTKMWDLVRDSKKLSEKQREKVFDFICQQFHVGIGLCSHETIDRINILEASFLAMKKAVQELLRKIPNDQFHTLNRFQISNNPLRQVKDEPSKMRSENTKYKIPDTRYMILVDGNKTIPNFSFEQRAIIGGDRLVKSISAASIVAKVTRDRMMDVFAEKYPSYGFEKHSGYGTKAHLDALTLHGPCAIHRKSFGPVKKSESILR